MSILTNPELMGPIPSIDDLKVTKFSDNHYKISLGPFQNGMGHTVGNAIRRIALSSIPGSAIVEARIDQATHEFTTIVGVEEDVILLNLNIKGIIVKINGDEPVSLKLSYKGGSNVITAGDFEVIGDAEIINKDHVLPI